MGHDTGPDFYQRGREAGLVLLGRALGKPVSHPDHFLHQQVEVLPPAAVVGDGNVQVLPAADRDGRRARGANGKNARIEFFPPELLKWLMSINWGEKSRRGIHLFACIKESISKE